MLTIPLILLFVFSMFATVVGIWSRYRLIIMVVSIVWLILAILLWLEWGGLVGLTAGAFLSLFAVILMYVASQEESEQ